jgi:hypothetical protein
MGKRKTGLPLFFFLKLIKHQISCLSKKKSNLFITAH